MSGQNSPMQPRSREEREGRREETKPNVDFFSFRARDAVKLDDDLERIAHAVIGAAIEVHRLLGPGLPEVVYRNALSHELTLRGIMHVIEAAIPRFLQGQSRG